MKSSRTRKLALATTALAAIVLAAQPASAQGLFNLLFGEPNQRHQNPQQEAVQPAPQPQPQRTQPASLPRVAGPSNYEYRPDALVRVDFSAIEIAAEDVRAELPSAGIQVASSEGVDPEIFGSVERLLESADEEALVSVEGAATLPVASARTAGDDGDEVSATSSEDADLASRVSAEIGQADEVAPGAEQALEGPGATDEPAEAVATPGALPTIEDAAPLEIAVDLAPVSVERAQALPEAEEVETAVETVTPVEDPLAASLRLTGPLLEELDAFELMTEKAVGDALVAHYSQHPDFIWVDSTGPNAASLQVLGFSLLPQATVSTPTTTASLRRVRVPARASLPISRWSCLPAPCATCVMSMAAGSIPTSCPAITT